MVSVRAWSNTTESALLLLTLAVSACATPTAGWSGLDVSSGQNRRISPRAGRYAFAGTYRSAQLGTLQLWENGARIHGQFDYARGSVRVIGTLEGSFDGNWLRFDWRETHRSCLGLTHKQGRGELFYDPPLGDQSRPRLFGRRDFSTQLAPPQKNFRELLRVEGGPITAIRLDTNPGAQPMACAATCSC